MLLDIELQQVEVCDGGWMFTQVVVTPSQFMMCVCVCAAACRHGDRLCGRALLSTSAY